MSVDIACSASLRILPCKALRPVGPEAANMPSQGNAAPTSNTTIMVSPPYTYLTIR